jgi:hypothetical protein
MRCTPQMVSMERKNRITIHTKVAARPFQVISGNASIPTTMDR